MRTMLTMTLLVMPNCTISIQIIITKAITTISSSRVEMCLKTVNLALMLTSMAMIIVVNRKKLYIKIARYNLIKSRLSHANNRYSNCNFHHHYHHHNNSDLLQRYKQTLLWHLVHCNMSVHNV